MARFTLPRDLYFGDNAIEELGNLQGYTRAMLVTGGQSMQKYGFLQQTEQALKSAGMEVRIFDGVEPDPSIETVQRGAAEMQEFAPDLIVAIGGGSPMDAAKAMWIFYEYPDLKFDDIKEPFSLPKLRTRAHFAAIPSTSGSASEVTAFSVITDYATGIKYPLADFEITPDIAVLDTRLPLTMPPSLIAYTGMDALTHAIEAYVATAATAFSDPLALHAISMVADSLQASYEGDTDARGRMHIAQCLAGMAFSNALLGIAHSIAHKTGARFELPHGCCNAIVLPFVIQYNARANLSRYADIARTLGLSGGSERQLTDSLIRMIRRMSRSMRVPQSFREAGVPREKFDQYVNDIAQQAVADPCTGSNPRAITAHHMKELLICAYDGKDVTF